MADSKTLVVLIVIVFTVGLFIGSISSLTGLSVRHAPSEVKTSDTIDISGLAIKSKTETDNPKLEKHVIIFGYMARSAMYLILVSAILWLFKTEIKKFKNNVKRWYRKRKKVKPAPS